MARKLEEACKASKDLERCLSDQEAILPSKSGSPDGHRDLDQLQVTHKVLQDEVLTLTDVTSCDYRLDGAAALLSFCALQVEDLTMRLSAVQASILNKSVLKLSWSQVKV